METPFEWWEAYLETIGDQDVYFPESIPDIIRTAKKLAKDEIREQIASMKYDKEELTMFEIAYNLAITNILKKLK